MRILVALAVSAMILGTAGVARAHDVAYDSQVTIRYGEGVPRVITNFFSGEVKSAKQRCERDRSVRVFHRIPGPDELVGVVKSEADGGWSLGNDIAQGRHYAKVRPRDSGLGAAHDHTCKADKSRVIVL